MGGALDMGDATESARWRAGTAAAVRGACRAGRTCGAHVLEEISGRDRFAGEDGATGDEVLYRGAFGAVPGEEDDGGLPGPSRARWAISRPLTSGMIRSVTTMSNSEPRAPQEREGRARVVRRGDVVPGACEDLSGEVAHGGLVFDKQDAALGDSLQGGGHDGDGSVRVFALHPRQVDLEAGASPGLGVDPDVAAGLADDPVDGGESEAGASAGGLGREEWFEEPEAGGAVHPDAGVGDGEHDVRARGHLEVLDGVGLIELDVGRLDGDRAAEGHGVAGVDDEVHDDLVDLASVGADEAGCVVKLDVELRRVRRSGAEASARGPARLRPGGGRLLGRRIGG